MSGLSCQDEKVQVDRQDLSCYDKVVKMAMQKP